MLWRAWCFVAGIPLGVLAALTLPEPSPLLLQIGAVLAGVLLVAIASGLARRFDDDYERGVHIARAANCCLLAIPAIAVTLLGLAPADWVLALGITLLLGLALYRAVHQRSSAGGFGRVLWGAVSTVVLGAVAIVALSGFIAALRGGAVERSDASRDAIYDLDARIETWALPDCSPKPKSVEVVLDRGAHPRITRDGASLWFDAGTENGSRQVYRFDLASQELGCWTCDEAGNNRRPAPNANQTSIVFDTDRYANWRAPSNTELQLLRVHGSAPRNASRRLTFHPGSDDHAIFSPTAGSLVWSRSDGGRYALASAAMQTGHGALLLADPVFVEVGGTRWVAPQAWSPDARSLAWVRGNPERSLEVVSLDPATGERRSLPRAAGTPAVSFSADGSWWVAASSARGSELVPTQLGFLGAAMWTSLGGKPGRLQGTRVVWGPTRSDAAEVELGPVADWGWPTGVALEPDARGFVLGQRRGRNGSFEERLLRIELECRG